MAKGRARKGFDQIPTPQTIAEQLFAEPSTSIDAAIETDIRSEKRTPVSKLTNIVRRQTYGSRALWTVPRRIGNTR